MQHLSNPLSNQNHFGSGKGFDIGNTKSFKHNGEIGLASSVSNENYFEGWYNVDNIHGGFDLRLKENFKLFVTGPSRCGKTVFVSELLENIDNFAKLPPTKVLYICKVWQPKYDEIIH